MSGKGDPRREGDDQQAHIDGYPSIFGRKVFNGICFDELDAQEAWVNKCKVRLMEVAGLDEALAKETAEGALEMVHGDTSECPVECADEELSYWARDADHTLLEEE